MKLIEFERKEVYKNGTYTYSERRVYEHEFYIKPSNRNREIDAVQKVIGIWCEKKCKVKGCPCAVLNGKLKTTNDEKG